MNEISTADIVREEIERDVYLQHLLSEDLVNNSALARKLLPLVKAKNKKATIESITVSIARYARTLQVKENRALVEQIAHSQIAMKNDVIHVTFPRSIETSNAINEAAKKIRWDQDEILFINQGSGDITVVFDRKNLKLFSKFLPSCIDRRDPVALLSILEAQDTTPSIDVQGLYAYFITQISRHGINILDIISTKSQITFVIVEEDLMKSYEIMNRCIQHYRERSKK